MKTKTITSKKIRKLNGRDEWFYSLSWVSKNGIKRSFRGIDFNSRKGAKEKLQFRLNGLLNNGYIDESDRHLIK